MAIGVRIILLLLLAPLTLNAQKINNGLTISLSGEPPASTSVQIANGAGRFGAGKTSLRYNLNKALKGTKEAGDHTRFARQTGYYTRDRDLGQTFTVPGKSFVLKAITVQVTDSIFAGAAGAKMSVQLFEVLGEPVINDNGTTTGQLVHWTNGAWTDDFITGETYRSLAVFRGGVLPKTVPGRSFLRFGLDESTNLQLEAGRRYAFLLMFDEPANDRAMALTNINTPDQNPYPGGHGIRREARGTKPIANNLKNSTFPPFAERIRITPTTNGYPDVDTYRDFLFYIEGR